MPDMISSFQGTGTQQTGDVFQQAKTQYPILNRYPDIQYKMSPGRGQGFMEFWPPGETGSPELLRPKEFDIGRPGVEVYNPAARPADIAGDIVSHHLVNIDPDLKADYSKFEQSLTAQQHMKLQEQYQHARRNEGENRPFMDWYKSSGLPAFLRGYLFDQWKNPESIYTPEQIQLLNTMKKKLK